MYVVMMVVKIIVFLFFFCLIVSIKLFNIGNLFVMVKIFVSAFCKISRCAKSFRVVFCVMLMILFIVFVFFVMCVCL